MMQHSFTKVDQTSLTPHVSRRSSVRLERKRQKTAAADNNNNIKLDDTKATTTQRRQRKISTTPRHLDCGILPSE